MESVWVGQVFDGLCPDPSGMVACEFPCILAVCLGLGVLAFLYILLREEDE